MGFLHGEFWGIHSWDILRVLKAHGLGADDGETLGGDLYLRCLATARKHENSVRDCVATELSVEEQVERLDSEVERVLREDGLVDGRVLCPQPTRW